MPDRTWAAINIQRDYRTIYTIAWHDVAFSVGALAWKRLETKRSREKSGIGVRLSGPTGYSDQSKESSSKETTPSDYDPTKLRNSPPSNRVRILRLSQPSSPHGSLHVVPAPCDEIRAI
jgi:hypothetical protein